MNIRLFGRTTDNQWMLAMHSHISLVLCKTSPKWKDVMLLNIHVLLLEVNVCHTVTWICPNVPRRFPDLSLFFVSHASKWIDLVPVETLVGGISKDTASRRLRSTLDGTMTFNPLSPLLQILSSNGPARIAILSCMFAPYALSYIRLTAYR